MINVNGKWKHTKEEKEKIGKMSFGRRMSKEAKQKISKSNTKYDIKIIGFVVKEYPNYSGSRKEFVNYLNEEKDICINENVLKMLIKKSGVTKKLESKKSIFLCKTCGKRIEIYKFMERFRKPLFCSKRCYGKSLSGIYPRNINKDAWKKAIKKNIENGHYERCRERMLNGGAQKARCACSGLKPNKKEKLLIKIIDKNNLDFNFVGDGKIFIGNFNPDFIHKDKKLIIELYGDYWHNTPRELKKHPIRTKTYKNNGYKLLVIWEHEINREDFIVEKINLFSKCRTCSTEVI